MLLEQTTLLEQTKILDESAVQLLYNVQEAGGILRCDCIDVVNVHSSLLLNLRIFVAMDT